MRLELFIPLLAASALLATPAGTAQSGRVASSPLVGNFSGGMVFYRTDGAFRETQYARLTLKALVPGATGSSVQWTFSVAPWNAAPVCTHQLIATKALRTNVELAFQVASMTGSCIPNASSYRISSVDRRRVAVQLSYSDGLTASGLLFRK